MPAITATVKARLMAADIASSSVFDTTATSFPANITNPQTKEVRLQGDVLVQVLDIENLSRSKWEQVEELEAVARGEQTRGREIIRLPTGDQQDEESGTGMEATQPLPSGRPSGGQASAAAPRNSTHRVVLQDHKGTIVYGLELVRIEKIGIGTMNIGEKILLKKGAVVARGVVLLEPSTCAILGGKIEAWQKAWKDGQLVRLKESIASETGS
jgi:RecQ-mediated genome instability protein 1